MGELPEFNQKHKGHSLTHTHKQAEKVLNCCKIDSTQTVRWPLPLSISATKKSREILNFLFIGFKKSAIPFRR